MQKSRWLPLCICRSRYDITLQGGLAPDVVCRDHPRGLTGLPDLCMANSLHLLAGLGEATQAQAN